MQKPNKTHGLGFFFKNPGFLTLAVPAGTAVARKN